MGLTDFKWVTNHGSGFGGGIEVVIVQRVLSNQDQGFINVAWIEVKLAVIVHFTIYCSVFILVVIPIWGYETQEKQ